MDRRRSGPFQELAFERPGTGGRLKKRKVAQLFGEFAPFAMADGIEHLVLFFLLVRLYLVEVCPRSQGELRGRTRYH